MAKPLKLVQNDDDPQPMRIPTAPPADEEAPPPGPPAQPANEIPPAPPAPEPEPEPEAEPDPIAEAPPPAPDPEDPVETDEDGGVEEEREYDAADDQGELSISASEEREVLSVGTAPPPKSATPLQVEEREPEILNVPRQDPPPLSTKGPLKVRKRAVRPRRHSKRKPRPSGKVVVHRKSDPAREPQRLAERYEILSTLGVGGSGTVYHAMDHLLETEVAIKVLSPDLVENEDLMTQLKNEARMAMQLSDTHIVRLHNLEPIENSLALVMEYVKGETLREIISKCGAFDLDTTAQILTACDRAVSHAHRHRVIHADLNPANIMLTDDGIIKIIDFGESCIPRTEIGDGEWITGTPPFMSPEQKYGQPVDIQTDVYNLGVTIYQLLTLELPYEAGTTPQEMLEVVPTALPRLHEPIRSVVETAIAPERGDRWQTVHDFAVAFQDAALEIG